MSCRWFVRLEGKERGPFSAAQLQELVDSGEISVDTEVRPSNRADWVPAQTVEGLFSPCSRGDGCLAVDRHVARSEGAEGCVSPSEQRYRQLLDAVAAYTYSVRLLGGVPIATEHSAACLAVTGYAPHEYALDPFLWINMVHPDDRERVRQHVAKMLDNETILPIEHRIVRKDGVIRWVRDTLVCHHDDSGTLSRYDGLVEDITDRKLAEERLRRLLESSPDAIVLVDRQGRIVLVNAEAERLFGFSRQELLEQTIEVLVPRSVRESHAAKREAYMAVPTARLLAGRELTACRKDGTEFPAEIGLSPIETEVEVVIAAAIRDITERKRTENLLRESEERFQLAVQGTDAGIWDWNLLTNQLYYSPRWKSMLGYEVNEIDDDLAEWESRLHPADRQRALATLQDYLEGKTAHYELEHRLRHKDGSYRWILARGALVRDREGRPYRMVGSHLDITERKQAERQQAQREGQLIAAQRIQEHLLPRSTPSVPGFDVAGALVPAQFAAGDFYDYLHMPDGALGIAVGDVSGHGFSSALLMASIIAHLRSFAEDHAHIEEVVVHTNAILFREVEAGRFATLILVRLDPASGTLQYVNAAHPSGYVLAPSGSVEHLLASSSLPIGLDANTAFPISAPVPLGPNQIVLLVTDGVLEAQAPDGAMFGAERMLEVVAANRSRTAHEIVESIQSAVRHFTQRREQEDDVTAVVIKVETSRAQAASADRPPPEPAGHA